MSVFPKFIEQYGGSINRKDVPEETVDKYKSLLPEEIIAFWKEQGFGGFADGLIWTIDPDECYGYKILLSRGGTCSLDNLEVVPFREYFDRVCQDITDFVD